MNPAEVLAVEIKKYAGAGLQTLVPRVYGQTAEAQRTRHTSPANKWDAETYFAEMKRRHGEQVAKTAQEILDWFDKRVTRIWWGEGK